MATFLVLKNIVANHLGRTDGGTANTIRDNSINYVREYEIANFYPFSWLRATTTLSVDSNGQADLPADFNPAHKPFDVRIVVTNGDDHIFDQINQMLFDSYGVQSYKYYIDYNTSTSRYRLNTKEVSQSVRVIYYYIPAALSADVDIDVTPDPDCVGYLAAARYWLAKERDETNHDRFKTLGLSRLNLMIKRDKNANALRVPRGSIYTQDLGFNLPD